MKPHELKDLQRVLKHYLDLTETRFKNDLIRRTAERLADLVERLLLKL